MLLSALFFVTVWLITFTFKKIYGKVYGKPFDKAKNGECNKFIYKQIKGSEEKIEKLSRTIYAG